LLLISILDIRFLVFLEIWIKENGESCQAAFPVFEASRKTRRKKLEAEAQTKLHLTRTVNLPFPRTPIVRFAEDEARVAEVEQLVYG